MNDGRHATSPHIGQLDGLRGLLALWVAVSHIFCWCGFAGSAVETPLERLGNAFARAAPAVDIFIILSGFVISLLLHERQLTYPAFLIGRCFRLFPVYLFCLGLGVATLFCTPFLLETISWRGNSYFDAVRAISEQEQSNLTPHLLWHLTLLFGIVPKAALPESACTIIAPA